MMAGSWTFSTSPVNCSISGALDCATSSSAELATRQQRKLKPGFIPARIVIAVFRERQVGRQCPRLRPGRMPIYLSDFDGVTSVLVAAGFDSVFVSDLDSLLPESPLEACGAGALPPLP